MMKDKKNPDCTIGVEYAYSGNGNEMLKEVIHFPTDKDTIAQFLKNAGVDGIHESILYIESIDTDIPGLDDALLDSIGFDELNYLAAKIQGMDEKDRNTFAAVLEAKNHSGDVREIINLTENLDCFKLLPSHDTSSYGDYRIERDWHECKESIQRLENSGNTTDRALAKFITLLNRSADNGEYGEHAANEDGCVFTSHGVLTEERTLQEVYHGEHDIPAEYKVYFLPEKEPCLKAENIDIVSFVLKTHALAGDYMDDANYNINVLLDKHGSEYLMLITNDNIFLTEEAHAYWQGTAAFNIWANTAQCSDVRAFAIHVKDQMSEVIGSISEIDFAERQRDILDNSIKYTGATAMLKYGEKKTFTAAEWDNISPAMHDRFKKQTMQYHPSDLHSLREHLQIANKGSNAIEKVVQPDTLLTAINRAYTERSPIKRSDLMHITQSAAKELLARDDIQVYRSLPEGVKRLSSLDAMPNRGGSIEQHLYEFAIKCDDLVGLDKWAKRVLGMVEAKRQQKQDILLKSKSRDNEL